MEVREKSERLRQGGLLASDVIGRKKVRQLGELYGKGEVTEALRQHDDSEVAIETTSGAYLAVDQAVENAKRILGPKKLLQLEKLKREGVDPANISERWQSLLKDK